jgi:putative glutamine amidotransferase
MRPKIGIPCESGYLEDAGIPAESYYQLYARVVEDVGGNPVFLSAEEEDLSRFDALVAPLDGLLFPGGRDLHPCHYGEDPHPSISKPKPELDQLDLALARWALRNDIPTLGICRGMQIINVALGGTLYQDLETQYPGALNHRQPKVPQAHRIYIEAGSRMQELLGTQELWVNSRHHQAIKTPGKHVFLTGRSPDGVAEAMEVDGCSFMVAVQCHPEELYVNEPAFARLFFTFVQACIVSHPVHS